MAASDGRECVWDVVEVPLDSEVLAVELAPADMVDVGFAAVVGVAAKEDIQLGSTVVFVLLLEAQYVKVLPFCAAHSHCNASM